VKRLCGNVAALDFSWPLQVNVAVRAQEAQRVEGVIDN
jgi:hypothetical protein